MNRAHFALLIIAFASLLMAGCSQMQQRNAAIATLGGPSLLHIRVVINSTGEPTIKNLEVENGTTAIDAFRKAADIQVKQYPFGAFVTGVNGLERNRNGNGKYWQYYFNGNLPMVSIDSYVLWENGVLEFRYEKPPEELS